MVARKDWQNLSKKERRRLKREQKRLKREQEIKRKRLMKWGSIFGTVILLAGGTLLYQYFQSRRYLNTPKIQVTPLTYNLGKVLASEGTVKANFEVKNVGVSPLVISGMETSCGCTTAKLKMEGKESPEFGMQGNPTDWSASIKPGSTAKLAVFFDPNFHKTVGPVTRTVSIFSNDPGKRKEKITIHANIQR